MNIETQAHHPDRHPAPHRTIDLRVRYIGARRPFEDTRADARETLAQLKPRVLEFFRLKEGEANGGTKVYEFAQNGVVLADLSQTLGSLADKHHDLKLDLLERFQQG